MIPAYAGRRWVRARSFTVHLAPVPDVLFLTQPGSGGGMGIRTPDPDLAKVVLYQLSYAPRWGASLAASLSAPGSSQMVGLSGLEPETSRLSGVCSNQLSYKPMWARSCERSSQYLSMLCPETERLADRDPQQRVGYDHFGSQRPYLLAQAVGGRRPRKNGPSCEYRVTDGMPMSDVHVREASLGSSGLSLERR